ncbi:MAG: NADH-quinone oxidoreductase subunit F [Chloroflexi bacterium]|nr:NADH-quinone oxidoreductase subunit F [Chloroflexota bacterium]
MGEIGDRFTGLRERAEAAHAAWRRPERPRIDVADDTSSRANGARATRAALERLAGERGAAVDLGRNHGYGMQWVQPLVTITWPDGASVLYGPVRPDDAAAILDEATGRVGAAAALAIGVLAGDRPGIPDIRDHPFVAPEPRERRLLRNLGLTDPESLDHYIATGGYRAVARALDRHLEPRAVRQLLADAALTGRGGAYFNTGVKWNFLAGAPDAERYVVCNADEGDPGAWVNRVILEGDPHLLIEGLLTAGYAMGARHGFIYIRDEYPLAIERVERAIRDAEAAGLLGEGILGSALDYRLEVIRGAGAYVCGDETGLLSSIQDMRGMPRIKPPFPAVSGAFYKPSNVNNVETYANAPFVLRHGAEWYHRLGTAEMRGTRLFTFSGDVERVGVLEVPFGTPLPALLQACGGIADGGQLGALQSGGPLGSMLPASLLPTLNTTLTAFRAHGGSLGSGGMVFLSDRACVVHFNEFISEFVEEESCGRCTTCHGGNQRMTEIFRRVIAGGGRREDRHNLELIDVTIQQSNCQHGQLSPTVMRNTLRHFSAQYDAHALGHRCATLRCGGMTRFVIADQSDPALADAAAICPVEAIRGSAGARWIDDEACIRCGACEDLAPRGVAREAVPVAPAIVPIS